MIKFFSRKHPAPNEVHKSLYLLYDPTHIILKSLEQLQDRKKIRKLLFKVQTNKQTNKQTKTKQTVIAK